MRKDDCSLTPLQLKKVRAEAKKALENAGANGQFPTPIDAVLDAAKVVVSPENVLNEGFLQKLRHKAGDALRKALTKVLGVFDVRDRLIFIDRSVAAVRQTFLKLHETAHALMPWQRKLYAVVEECDKTLSPEASDLFDREANVFASEVLFQLDLFTKEASDYNFDINVPIKLSKKYGASIYSTIRRYVSTNHRTCVVVVLDPPQLKAGDGFTASVRRVIASDTFESIFSRESWPTSVTPDDQIGAMVPLRKAKMTGKRILHLIDKNGVTHQCVAESFTNTYQVFVLIHVEKELTKILSSPPTLIF